MALAGLLAGAALFTAAAGLAGEHGAIRTFDSRGHFHGPSSFSGGGVFFRSDGVEIHLGTSGLLRERRFGFDHRWDHDFRDRGFDRHRFLGPRVWHHRFMEAPVFGIIVSGMIACGGIATFVAVTSGITVSRDRAAGTVVLRKIPGSSSGAVPIRCVSTGTAANFMVPSIGRSAAGVAGSAHTAVEMRHLSVG